jgi:hypothetical protein
MGYSNTYNLRVEGTILKKPKHPIVLVINQLMI